MNLEQFPGVNAGYVFELYDRYRQNPDSVDPATRKVFESWTPTDADSQIFILKGTNPALNGKYTMIGHVTKGMEVVDKIEFADVLKGLSVKGETPK